MPAPTMSASCSFRGARAISSWRRRSRSPRQRSAASRRLRSPSIQTTRLSTGSSTTVHPNLLQLHGSETPDRVASIRARFGLPIIKAIGVASADDAAKAAEYRGIADLILFDAKAPEGSDLPGGQGRSFDWSVLSRLSAERPFALSGGLDPDNVWEALAITGASMVDVSSGVELANEKDEYLVRRFIQSAKAPRPEPKARAS